MAATILKCVYPLICILFALASGFFLYRLVSAFVQVKEKRMVKPVFFFLLSGTSGMVIWIGDNNLLMTFPVFLVCYMASTQGARLGRLATAIVFFCLIMSVCAILDTYLQYDAAASIIRPVVFGMFYFLLRRWLPQGPIQLSPRLWKLVLGLSAMSFCALAAVVLLTYGKYDSAEVYALSMNQGLVVLPFVLLTSVIILMAILTLADYERLMQERRLASLQEVYYQGILREQNQVRMLRHDLRNHLTVLQALAENGDTEKVQSYLEQIVGSPALQGSRQLCENEAANAVLAAKAEDMARKGLVCDFQIILPPALPIADTDLCALLGNALDNAMEAAVKAEDKRILVRCKADKGIFMLKVGNSLAGDENEQLTTTKQDKKHHGFGLAEMREIAVRYGGSLEVTVRGGHFVLLVCLPLSDHA